MLQIKPQFNEKIFVVNTIERGLLRIALREKIERYERQTQFSTSVLRRMKLLLEELG